MKKLREQPAKWKHKCDLQEQVSEAAEAAQLDHKGAFHSAEAKVTKEQCELEEQHSQDQRDLSRLHKVTQYREQRGFRLPPSHVRQRAGAHQQPSTASLSVSSASPVLPPDLWDMFQS